MPEHPQGGPLSGVGADFHDFGRYFRQKFVIEPQWLVATPTHPDTFKEDVKGFHLAHREFLTRTNKKIMGSEVKSATHFV